MLLCGYRLRNVGVQQNRGTNLVGIFLVCVPLCAVQSLSLWMTPPQSSALVLGGVVVTQRVGSSALALVEMGRGKDVVELESFTTA